MIRDMMCPMNLGLIVNSPTTKPAGVWVGMAPSCLLSCNLLPLLKDASDMIRMRAAILLWAVLNNVLHSHRWQKCSAHLAEGRARASHWEARAFMRQQ
eukprot:2249725-Amphidinium_carterae.1